MITLLLKLAKWYIKKQWGYCSKEDRPTGINNNGVIINEKKYNSSCGGCEAADVCDWIDRWIDLENSFK